METYLNDFPTLGNESKCFNLTGESMDWIQSFGYTKGESIYRSVIQPVIMYSGMLGNLSFISVFVLVSWMHSVTNMYLASLAVADLIFLGVFPLMRPGFGTHRR